MKKEVRSYYSSVSEEDLDRIFNTSEEDVGTFVDTLSDVIEQKGGNQYEQDTLRKIVSGKPDAIKTPDLLTDYVSGFVRIFCGWHNDDYVWHIEPASIRRPWKVRESRIIYVVAKIMSDNLPSDLEAKIFYPEANWENRSITFKALEAGDSWSFDKPLVEKINQTLFDVLNKFV